MGTSVGGGTDYDVGPGDLVFVFRNTAHFFNPTSSKFGYLLVDLPQSDPHLFGPSLNSRNSVWSEESKALPTCGRLSHTEPLVLIDHMVDHRTRAGRHAEARIARQADTLIRGHRKGFRLFWRWKSKAPGGPSVPVDLQQLNRGHGSRQCDVGWRSDLRRNCC